MKTATVRDLRYDFPRIEAWLRDGEEIRITKRSRPIARLVAERLVGRRGRSASVPWPDFAARRKQIWGRRFFSVAEVKAMRDLELGES